MGIKGLTKLLSDEAPDCVKEVDLASLTGRKVAIDASMALYQFLIAVRSGAPGQASTQLTNESGEVTSHIQGIFNRTIRMLTSGVKPVYVFDGKPPTFKSGELAKRQAKRAKAQTDLDAAKEGGTIDEVDKFSKRLVRVTKQHNEDTKNLLRLMGVPSVDALSEAEAQCSVLVKDGKVYGTGTEDMDALTFGTTKLLRHMTFSGKSNQKILEFDYNKAIAGLDITPDQFVDLCILCGCDYTDSIRGIGPKKALGYIKKYKTIEGVLKILDKSKYGIPVDWLPPRGASGAAAGGDESEPAGDEDNDIDADDEEVVEEEDADISGDEKDDALPADASLPEQANTEAKGDYGDDSEFIPAYVEARRLFKTPEAHPSSNFELVWRDPDEEGLKTFLVDKMQFNPERVSQGIKKLKDARKGGGQKRIDGFFKVLPSAEGAGTKRKPAPASTAGKGKGKGKARSAFKKGKK